MLHHLGLLLMLFCSESLCASAVVPFDIADPGGLDSLVDTQGLPSLEQQCPYLGMLNQAVLCYLWEKINEAEASGVSPSTVLCLIMNCTVPYDDCPYKDQDNGALACDLWCQLQELTTGTVCTGTPTGLSYSSGHCPCGWTLFGTQCYRYFDNQTTWSDAEATCAAEGGHLASINSKDENDFIHQLSLCTQQDFWIGSHDDDADRHWLWTDNSEWEFAAWARVEHTGNWWEQQCGHMFALGGTLGGRGYAGGEWHIVMCSLRYNFVCQHPIISSAAPTVCPTQETCTPTKPPTKTPSTTTPSTTTQSTTTLPTPTEGCPKERPSNLDVLGACLPSDEGLTCPYGNQTCCGNTSPEMFLECQSEQWSAVAVDTPCVIGYSCPTESTTTPTAPQTPTPTRSATPTEMQPEDCEWLQWINNDGPTWTCDCESYRDANLTCEVEKYEVSLASGGPVYTDVTSVPHNNLVFLPTVPGISCLNKDQENCKLAENGHKDGPSPPCCLDYKIRFCCKTHSTPTNTQKTSTTTMSTYTTNHTPTHTSTQRTTHRPTHTQTVIATADNTNATATTTTTLSQECNITYSRLCALRVDYKCSRDAVLTFDQQLFTSVNLQNTNFQNGMFRAPTSGTFAVNFWTKGFTGLNSGHLYLYHNKKRIAWDESNKQYDQYNKVVSLIAGDTLHISVDMKDCYKTSGHLLNSVFCVEPTTIPSTKTTTAELRTTTKTITTPTITRTVGGPSIPVVFQKSEEFTITKGNKLMELSVLGRQFIITFQLFITAPTNSGYTNIIHLTIGGMNGKYGDRTPGIWIWKGTGLTVRSAINGNPDYHMDTSTYQLALNTWHSIEVSQLDIENEVYFTFKVDGTAHANVKNNDAQEFKNVKIYAGDPWEIPSSGKIRNLEIKTM